ncbi:hypothetical protein AB0302_00510 [Micrococcus sp. NPDC078436]|uniref:hypothetical protein n=1 Tax=Micrococcus sp. NPDC078436 TaxID=3154960 RepID=UPI00344C978A
MSYTYTPQGAELRDSLEYLRDILRNLDTQHARYRQIVQSRMGRLQEQRKPLPKPLLAMALAAVVVLVLGFGGDFGSALYRMLGIGVVAIALGAYWMTHSAGSARVLSSILIAVGAMIDLLLLVPAITHIEPADFTLPLLAAGLILAPILAIAIREKRLPEVNASIAERNEQMRTHAISTAEPELRPVREQIQALNAAYTQGGFDDWFPHRYMSGDVVAVLHELVRDRRADTLSEAIREYETILHRQDMAARLDAQAAQAERHAAAQARRDAIIGGASFGMQIYQGSATRRAIRQAAATPRTVYLYRR